MVQPIKDRHLDDVILSVFEQAHSGRHFFFPVTSQNDARAFVRELNRLGVQYPAICAAVGEFEQNFTSWRTGLNRPGVGNRVVERINRPVQELLLTADDQDKDADVRLSDVEDDDDFLTKFSSSLPAISTEHLRKIISPTKSAQCDNRASAKTDDQKTVNDTDKHDETSLSSRVELPQERSNSDALCLETEENNNSCVNESASVSDKRDVTDEHNIKELEIQTLTDVVEKGVTGDDGAEVMEGTEGLRVDNWVTELSVQLATDAEPSTDHRQIAVTLATTRPSFEPSQHTNVTHATTTTTTTTTTTIESSSSERTSTAILQHRTADTDQPEVNGYVTSEPLVETHSMIATSGQPTNDRTASNEMHLPEMNGHVVSLPEVQTTAAKVVNSCTKPEVGAVMEQHEMTSSKPEVEATATLEVTSSVKITSEPEVEQESHRSIANSTTMGDQPTTDHTPEVYVSQMTSLPVLTSLPEVPTTADDVVDSCTNPEAVAVMQEQEMTSQITTASDDEVKVTSSQPEVDATATPEVTSSEIMTSDIARKCELRKRPTKDARGVDDVDENYDSEEDPDVESSQDGGRGWQNGRKRWGRHYDDGPGYVYVFTDTPADCSARCRVKISASRRPEARLRQAQLFNVDMRLVSAVKVTRRLAAASTLRQTLSDAAIAGTLDWFNTSLDVVVNGIMDVTRIYSPPIDQLHD